MKAAFKVDGKVEQKNVLFDRCVKVDFGTSRAGGNKVITIEYNPHFSNKDYKLGSLCTRIEGSIVDVPKVNNKTRTPGFTATLKIYNDNGDLAAECAKRATIATDIATSRSTYAAQLNAYKEFKNSKLWATIYLGYWNEDMNAADYTQVFSGIVQSYYSYRRGTDLITELQCSDIPIEAISQDQMNLIFDSGPNAVKTQKEESEGIVKAWNPSVKTWDELAKLAIQQKSKYKAKKITNWARMSIAPVEVTSEDRGSTNWFKINYNDPADINLETDALTRNASSAVGLYYSQTEDFDSIWADLLSIFPNGNVGCKIEDDNTNGIRNYNIYRLGKRSLGKTEGKNVYHIYDYQNLIDTPTLGTTSGLTVNMLLRPEVKAGNYLQLDLSDDAKKNLGTSIGLGSVGNSQFTSLLQGEKAQVAKSQGAKNGSIFNTPFLIFSVTHKFSTHSNNWKTTVTTVPQIFNGGK